MLGLQYVWGVTQTFSEFFCCSFTTYRNFYSPLSPSKQPPLALIQRSQRDFHDRKHRWKSFRVSVFITSCDSVWISSKHHSLRLNFIFGNRKKSKGGGGIRWIGRMGDDRRFRGSQRLPHNERRVSRVVFTMQGLGVVAPLVWTSEPDVYSWVASERRNRIFVVAFIAEQGNFIFFDMYVLVPVYFIWPWKSRESHRTFRDVTPGSLSATDTCIVLREAFRSFWKRYPSYALRKHMCGSGLW
jgi:hypothetical protein